MWLFFSQNHKIPWVGRDPQGPSSLTPGSAQDRPKSKLCVWEWCSNAPWIWTVWGQAHCLGQSVPGLRSKLQLTRTLRSSVHRARAVPSQLQKLNSMWLVIAQTSICQALPLWPLRLWGNQQLLLIQRHLQIYLVYLPIPAFKSTIRTLKRTSPKTEPCGTPVVTDR